jgi:probable rRNA maturation factor
MAAVHFHYADVRPLSLKKKKVLKDFVVQIFLKEGKGLETINFIFCSDSYLLEINKSYLRHDYYTDIITFDLSEGDLTVGEVYISIDRVKENSEIHATSFREELLRVIFHGALHLIGYKDKKKSEITLMREKEEYYLRLFEAKK